MVGLSTIYNTYLQIKAKFFKVERISQGSDYPRTPRAKARFCSTKQLATKFGQLDPTTVPDPTNLDLNMVTNVPEIFP